MSDSKFISRFLWFFLLAAAIIFTLVLYVDPFQIYHKPLFSGQLLNENQRYQNAGLIDTYLSDPGQGYDSAAFGTSASVNFTSENISKTLGWKKTSRLFLPGGSPAEIKQTVLRAVSTGNIKHILLEMDLWSMNGDYRDVDNPAFPLYLYNDSRSDDIKYFIDLLVVWESLKTLFGKADTRNGTPEMLGYWADGYWVKDQHSGLNNIGHISALATEHLTLTPWSVEKISSLHYPALDAEMAPLFASLCNTDLEVVLFIPPYSMLYFMEKKDDIYSVIYEPRTILKSIDRCKNIRLHAFDVMDFTADLNNYKDHRHYLLHVSNKMLEWMGKREHVLSSENISSYENQWLDKLNKTHIYSTYPNEPEI